MSRQVTRMTQTQLSTVPVPLKATYVCIFKRVGVHPARRGSHGVVLIPADKCDDRSGTWGVTRSMLIASVFLQLGASAMMQLTPRAGLKLSFFQLAGLVPLMRTA